MSPPLISKFTLGPAILLIYELIPNVQKFKSTKRYERIIAAPLGSAVPMGLHPAFQDLEQCLRKAASLLLPKPKKKDDDGQLVKIFGIGFDAENINEAIKRIVW